MIDSIFEQLKFTRSYTLRILNLISTDMAEKIPTGFNNHIHWNAGHILGAYEQMLFLNTGDALGLSKEVFDFFKSGSKPSDWKSEPPTFEEIIAILEKQTERIVSTYEGRLDEELNKEMKLGSFEIKTIRDVISFNIFHEGLHAGLISGLKRTIGQ